MMELNYETATARKMGLFSSSLCTYGTPNLRRMPGCDRDLANTRLWDVVVVSFKAVDEALLMTQSAT